MRSKPSDPDGRSIGKAGVVCSGSNDEQPPALLDFVVGKATLQEAVAVILHRPELDLGDEVTSTSQLTMVEIISYGLRPDEVRTYGRRIYNSTAGRWVWERRPA